MGRFDEDLFREISAYMTATYPGIATLVRKDFNDAAAQFDDDPSTCCTSTARTRSKRSATTSTRGSPSCPTVPSCCSTTPTSPSQNTGEAALRFGVRTFFEGVKAHYPHLEFSHCWGLGVLIVGREAPPAVLELADMARRPEFAAYFADQGAKVSKRFEDMHVPLPVHGAFAPAPPVSLWRRAVNKLQRILRRLRTDRPTRLATPPAGGVRAHSSRKAVDR